jgi:hypothetical protein
MFALRVLWTLPQAHQKFLFHEICGLCRHYLRSKPGDASEISSEELVIEVWAKQIGRVGVCCGWIANQAHRAT